ncbi:hypothetical protein [Nannocystis sp.]|uniref:hypothetical protein n=1 Tax=Nannocystis sp. TaxID=1962667 RepID=UPI0025F76B1B|nr:hypothetical protein [Nannocystis sp.]MBK7830300.1 hypothetical protein [Nannocystis sp.]
MRRSWAVSGLMCGALVGACDPSTSGAGGILAGLASIAGAVACPELTGRESALRASFSPDPKINLKVAAFVQATRQLVAVAYKMEATVGATCRAIGGDLGIDAAEMEARDDAGPTQAACAAVRARIDAALQAGVRFSAEFTPPVCEVDAKREASCDARCKLAGAAGEVDADCRGSCQAGVQLAARCSKPALRLSVSSELAELQRLAASLQRRLPALIVAEVKLATRAVVALEQVATIGASLEGKLDDASAHAKACVAAASVAVATAGLRIGVSVKAGASVRAGAGVNTDG